MLPTRAIRTVQAREFRFNGSPASLEETLARLGEGGLASRLLRSLAHELNNILFAISAKLYTVTRLAARGEPLQPDIEASESYVQVGADLASLMLDIGHLWDEEPPPADAAKVVTTLGPLLERLVGAGSCAVVAGGGARLLVDVDPGELAFTVISLVILVDDADEPAEIEVRTTRGAADEAVWITVLRAGVPAAELALDPNAAP